MATLSDGGRIRLEMVEQEIERLGIVWTPQEKANTDMVLLRKILGKQAAELDLFDAVQLAKVIRVCRKSKSLAEAGRKLFQYSRTKKKSSNDSDRVSKYLAGFSLDWERVTND